MAPCDVENGSASATAPLLDVPEHTVVAEEPAQAVRIGGLAKQFGWLGWAAFGGPSAHVSLFQKVPQLPRVPLGALSLAGLPSVFHHA